MFMYLQQDPKDTFDRVLFFLLLHELQLIQQQQMAHEL